MTYLHETLRLSYCQRWRILRLCSEWEEVGPRRSDGREKLAFLKKGRSLKGEENCSNRVIVNLLQKIY